jgi:hypothetical protein
MLKASPLIHGVGKGTSSIFDAPDRAAAKDLGAIETGAAADCTMAETDGAASDTHGQGHVYAICSPLTIHQNDSNIDTRVTQPL